MKRAEQRKIKLLERKLGREKADGQAWLDRGLIEIDPRQNEQARLDTVVHETLHVLLPDFHEAAVRLITARVAGVIWQDGWRRVRGLQEHPKRKRKKRRPR